MSNSEYNDRTMIAMETLCAGCGQKVGILWFKGQSTLFEGPIDTDGLGNLVVALHHCDNPGLDPRSSHGPHGRKPTIKPDRSDHPRKRIP